MRTVLAAAYNRVYCTSAALEQYDKKRACTSAGSCALGLSAVVNGVQSRGHRLFPGKVSHKTEQWYQEKNEVEHRVCPEPWNDPLVFSGESDSGRDDCVQRKEEHGEDERSWNSYVMMLAAIHVTYTIV